jgi:hypothetical protein
VCTIEKMPRSAAVALEGGARGEQGQDNRTLDTDPVPNITLMTLQRSEGS